MTTMLPGHEATQPHPESQPHTEALAETESLAQTPAGPPPAHPPASLPRKSAGTGRSATRIGATALLAALLASGATLAVDRTLNDSNAAATPAAVTADTAANVGAAAGDFTWTSVAGAVTPSVVSITVTGPAGSAAGSGVVWDDAGHIVTNDHVVSGAGRGAAVTVTLADGHTYEASVVGTDPTTDLAVLQLVDPPADLVPLAHGDSAALQVGDPVMAVGNPLGLSGTVTTGIVSALNRPVATGGAGGQGSLAQVTNAIQTSAPINPGNSGGALVDSQGRLIGINSSIATLGSAGTNAQSGNIGIGFAIPIREVENIASQLISTGAVEHAYLGINVRDASVDRGTATISGALVVDAVVGGPADTAGLQAGDVVVAVDDTPVTGSEGLIGAIRGLAVDETVTLTVLRDSAQTSQNTSATGSSETTETTVEVTLAAAPTS